MPLPRPLNAVLARHPGGPGRISLEGHAAACAEIEACLDREGPSFAANRHIVPDRLGNHLKLSGSDPLLGTPAHD